MFGEVEYVDKSDYACNRCYTCVYKVVCEDMSL